MVTRRAFIGFGAAAATAIVGSRVFRSVTAAELPDNFAVTHTDAEWRKLLTRDQYAVLRQSATEMPGSSKLLGEHRQGTCSGHGGVAQWY